MTKKVRLTIKCQTEEVPVAFKTLAIQISADFEETLKHLLQLEKEHPLQKRVKGLVEHL